MADFYDELTDKLIKFIEEQPMFFTATAAADGRINLSPKGLDTLRVLDTKTVGYVDYVGSGNETAAHIARDGRMTMMFNSFTRNALILRLYGRGRIVRPEMPEWAATAANFPLSEGTRQIVLLDIENLQTSCGWGVPEMTLTQQRDTMDNWAGKKGEEGLLAYQDANNRVSIDGFDAMLPEASELKLGNKVS